MAEIKPRDEACMYFESRGVLALLAATTEQQGAMRRKNARPFSLRDKNYLRSLRVSRATFYPTEIFATFPTRDTPNVSIFAYVHLTLI